MSARDLPGGPTTVIRPTSGWVPLRLRDLMAHHELLYFLTWRNLKVRYKQTALGASWAILQPLATMLVFTLFFGKLARVPSDGHPYAIFSYAALVPWTYFANALTQASNSLVEHERLVTKVYFPRLLLPLSSVIAGLVDFAIAFVVLIGLGIHFGVTPGTRMLILPLLIVLMVATALGAALWLSALNVQYRDVRYGTPFLIQFWLFVTPVAYPSSLIPARWHIVYGLNPMAGVVEGFRWTLLGTASPVVPVILSSLATATVILLGGLYYFRRMERTFADVV
jgi:lipopolysaccharide transport system permease protein